MESNDIIQIQTYVNDNNLDTVEKSDEEGFEKVKSDIIEFMDCAKRCILPHNQLMYNIIINALEMMIVRMEHEDNIRENITNVMTSKSINFDGQQQNKKQYDVSQLSDEVKTEIDSIINEILADDDEEEKN